MARMDVPRFVSGLDDDLVQVGRPVVGLKARLLADMVHHVASHRRPGGMHSVYQVDQATTRGVTANEEWQWRWLTGVNSSRVWIRALTLGAQGGSTGAHSALTADTTTDTTTTFATASAATAPGSSISADHLAHDEIIQEITPNGTGETAVVDQNIAGKPVYVLAVSLDELPSPHVDSTDALSINLRTKFVPGRDIIDTDYDDLPLALHTMRRSCKKVLHSTCKIVTTTTTTANADIYTGSAVNLLLWDLYMSLVRPQNTTTPVTCAVRAAHSGSDGRVRFNFGTGTPGNITVNSATPAWYTTAANIAKDYDTLSLQCWGNSAGTFTLYGAAVLEQQETA